MKVGVIGLGRMGAPIAAALSEVHDVRVFDVDHDRRAAPIGLTRVVESAAEAIRGRDVVVTVLPGPGEVEEVVGSHTSDFAIGACWLDLSTGDPRVTRRLSGTLTARGVGCVSAPMAGGPTAADDRDLHFTVAGAPHSVRSIAPLLEVLSAEGGVEVVSENPMDAQTVKLLSNVLWFVQVVAVTEAMLLGVSTGLDPTRLRDLLATRSGTSPVLEENYGSVLRGDYMASFGIDRVTEQLSTATSLAAEMEVPFELCSLVEGVHRAALAKFGPVAGELLAARLVEERAGLPLENL